MEFVSKYAGMQYKIPESNKTIKFNAGRASVPESDSQSISYLKGHGDFGNTLTVVESAKPSMTVSVDFCPVDGCDFVARNEQGLMNHIKAKHPEYWQELNRSEGEE